MSDVSTRHYPPAEFCRVLTEGRRAAGLSLRQLATQVGTNNFSYMGKLERGERSPSRAVAERLVCVLALSGEAASAVMRAAVPGTGWDRSGR